MAFYRSSHSVFECQYHLVWVTKYRKRALKFSHEREFCEKVLRRAAEDHVHIYMDIPPQKSVGRAVQILKSISARAMFIRFKYLRGKFWSGELWGDSYFVRTVGDGVTAQMVKRYIEQHSDRGLEPAQVELFPKEKVRAKR